MFVVYFANDNESKNIIAIIKYQNKIKFNDKYTNTLTHTCAISNLAEEKYVFQKWIQISLIYSFAVPHEFPVLFRTNLMFMKFIRYSVQANDLLQMHMTSSNSEYDNGNGTYTHTHIHVSCHIISLSVVLSLFLLFDILSIQYLSILLLAK